MGYNFSVLLVMDFLLDLIFAFTSFVHVQNVLSLAYNDFINSALIFCDKILINLNLHFKYLSNTNKFFHNPKRRDFKLFLLEAND